MKRIMQTLAMVVFICTVFMSLAIAEQPYIPEPKAKAEDSLIRQLGKEKDAIEVTGRLESEVWGEEEALIMHSQDASTYIIEGGLTEKLKDLLFELGEKNLISLKGYKTGKASVECKHSYRFDPEGNKKAETRCFKYENLEVLEIINSGRSEEEMPQAKRDAQEEARAQASALYSDMSRDVAARGGAIIQYEGTVKEINIKSPIKSMVVNSKDKEAKLRQLTLLLTANTRVAKEVNKEKGMGLDIKALKKGQKVVVVYSRDGFNCEALNITIKE